LAVALAAGLIGYEAAAHWAAVQGHGTALGALIALGPALAALLLIALRTRRFVWLALAGLIGLAVAILIARRGAPSLTFLYPLPSVSLYLLLLWAFGRTLAPPRGARHRARALCPRHIAAGDRGVYTARELGMVCALRRDDAHVPSVRFAPLKCGHCSPTCSPCLIALIPIGEYAYRVARYRDFARVSLLTAVRAFRDRGRAAVFPARGG
jgi:hypothetical protein